jgi:hypothetical protein
MVDLEAEEFRDEQRGREYSKNVPNRDLRAKRERFEDEVEPKLERMREINIASRADFETTLDNVSSIREKMQVHKQKTMETLQIDPNREIIRKNQEQTVRRMAEVLHKHGHKVMASGTGQVINVEWRLPEKTRLLFESCSITTSYILASESGIDEDHLHEMLKAQFSAYEDAMAAKDDNFKELEEQLAKANTVIDQQKVEILVLAGEEQEDHDGENRHEEGVHEDDTDDDELEAAESRHLNSQVTLQEVIWGKLEATYAELERVRAGAKSLKENYTLLLQSHVYGLQDHSLHIKKACSVLLKPYDKDEDPPKVTDNDQNTSSNNCS